MLVIILLIAASSVSENDLKSSGINGSVKSVKCRHYNIDDSFGKSIRRYAGYDYYEYDRNGFISKYEKVLSNGSVEDKWVGSFTQNGAKREVCYYTYGKYLSHKRLFEYTDGVLRQMTEYNEEGKSTIKYTYFRHDNVRCVVSFPDGSYMADTTYSIYDSLNRITNSYKSSLRRDEIVYKYGNGVDTVSAISEYSGRDIISQRDEKGHLIEHTEYSVNNEGVMSIDYNDAVSPLKDYKVNIKCDSFGNEVQRTYLVLNYGSYQDRAIDLISIQYY